MFITVNFTITTQLQRANSIWQVHIVNVERRMKGELHACRKVQKLTFFSLPLCLT